MAPDLGGAARTTATGNPGTGTGHGRARRTVDAAASGTAPGDRASDAAPADFAVASTVLAGLMVYYGIGVTWTILFLPRIIAVQVIFTAGVALLLAMGNLFYHEPANAARRARGARGRQRAGARARPRARARARSPVVVMTCLHRARKGVTFRSTKR